MTTLQKEYHGGVAGVRAAAEEARDDFNAATEFSSEHGSRVAVALEAHPKFLGLLHAAAEAHSEFLEPFRIAAEYHKNEVTPAIVAAGTQTRATRDLARRMFDVCTETNPYLDAATQLINRTAEASDAERGVNNNVVTAYEEALVASNAIAAWLTNIESSTGAVAELLNTIRGGTAEQPERLNEMGDAMGLSAQNLLAYEETT